MSVTPLTLPPEVIVRPWSDPLVEAHGFDPLHPYIEFCWTARLGPTATLLYRRLGVAVINNPDGREFDLVELATSLGLGEGLGRHSLLAKAMSRLCRFEAARWQSDGYAVRRALAPLPARELFRVSESARHAHRAITEGGTRRSTAPALPAAATNGGYL